LCCVTGAAQTIDKETFEKLVDYVTCKYTDKCIKSYKKKRSNDSLDIINYNNIIQPKLDACTPGHSLSINELDTLLKKNDWRGVNKNFTQLFHKSKKGKFRNGMSTQEAIDSLTTLQSTDFAESMKKRIPSSDVINRIQKDLDKYITSINDTTSSQPTPTGDKAGTIKTENKSNSYPLLWLILIVILILIFILFWQRYSSKRIEKIINPLLLKCKDRLKQCKDRLKQLCKDRLKQYEDKLKQYEDKLKQYEDKLKQHEDKLKQHEDRLKQHEDKPKQHEDKPKPYIDNSNEIELGETPTSPPDDPMGSNIGTEQPEEPIADTKYVKVYQDKIFHQFSDSPQGCDFKIFNIQGNTADFEFCGDKNTALAKQYIFDSICEIIGSPKVPHDIITVENGKVMCKDGKWEVAIPAKIKFE
jgi:uncharacterized protein YukE